MQLLTVNMGTAERSEHTGAPGNLTGIGKRPVSGPVRVVAPGPRGEDGSGLVGDAVCDLRHHGGDEQAVYAYAREDLDAWEKELGRELPAGAFGENLTTLGVDVNSALLGERWQVGSAVLQVSSMRVPCRTFAGHLGEERWVRRFTERALPGAYFRVVEEGALAAGDTVKVTWRPGHSVTVGLLFRALTGEPELLPRLAEAEEWLPEVGLARLRARVG
ncbi:MOSC domain-containing protein [Streptomyces sulphureus]|uniref:MOSC domain-containing protein n=1 Tax=Streptomyces sulphureus TaxID=47758 RepID=UPI00036FF93F|nr:MOSC domain-containing protein [Streptomyces sulphureus]